MCVCLGFAHFVAEQIVSALSVFSISLSLSGCVFKLNNVLNSCCSTHFVDSQFQSKFRLFPSFHKKDCHRYSKWNCGFILLNNCRILSFQSHGLSVATWFSTTCRDLFYMPKCPQTIPPSDCNGCRGFSSNRYTTLKIVVIACLTVCRWGRLDETARRTLLFVWWNRLRQANCWLNQKGAQHANDVVIQPFRQAVLQQYSDGRTVSDEISNNGTICLWSTLQIVRKCS